MGPAGIFLLLLPCIADVLPKVLAQGCTAKQFRCTNGQCIDLSMICDGQDDCFDESDEKSTTCISHRCPLDSFQCDYGGCIDRTKKCDKFEDCKDESDEKPELCNPKTNTQNGQRNGCQLTKKDGILYLFEHVPSYKEDVWKLVDLYKKKSFKPFTMVKFQCNYGFIATWRGFETNCDQNGRWDPAEPECIPCGKNETFVRPLIYRAPTANKYEYPWQAALFKKAVSDGKEVVQFNCGASIINEKAVLTAAHCMFDPTQTIPTREDELLIAVGIYYSNWDKQEDPKQKFSVERIFVHEKYARASGSFDNDIAIAVLQGTIRFTKAALPICLDLENAHPLPPVADGTVVGWGYTELSTSSLELRVAKLTYYDWDNCWKLANLHFKRYVTYDKFCAGLYNGTHLAEGDSGGGLTYSVGAGKVEYLYGIVSIADSNDKNITTFTNATEHRTWIRSKINQIRLYA